MSDQCTGCGAQTEYTNTVTVTRKNSVSFMDMQIGKRRRTRGGGNGTVFVGEGLCDNCAGHVIETVKLKWTSQELKARRSLNL